MPEKPFVNFNKTLKISAPGGCSWWLLLSGCSNSGSINKTCDLVVKRSLINCKMPVPIFQILEYVTYSEFIAG